MSKPTILLIPGSFTLPASYSNVIDPVASQGYSIHGLHLPSIGLSSGAGRPGEPATMYDDAAFIAREVTQLAEQGKDVILLPHSYAGVPTTESLKGLSKEERRKAGKIGGVVRIAYMTALVPPVGVAAGGVMVDLPEEQQVEMKVDENGFMVQDPSISAPIVFSDLPQEEGEAQVKELARHSAISFAGELTYAGYKDVPVSYLLCEDDLTIPVKYQRAGIDLIEEASGRKVDVTSVETGHCPNASAPHLVIDWILDVARKS